MGILYDVNVRTISDHFQKVFIDNELQQDSVVRNFRITATAMPAILSLKTVTQRKSKLHLLKAILLFKPENKKYWKNVSS